MGLLNVILRRRQLNYVIWPRESKLQRRHRCIFLLSSWRISLIFRIVRVTTICEQSSEGFR